MTDLINILLPPAKIRMKVALFFGSFNPVHIGHLAIANYSTEFTDNDQLWFIVSPQNPLKEKKGLLNDNDRLELMLRAVDDDPRFRVSDIEFRMPRPSYTVDTLSLLKKNYPGHTFSVIMGSDNLINLPKWKNFQEIPDNHVVYVYPRPGFDASGALQHHNIRIIPAPLMDISSTFIRESIRDGKNMRFFLPQKVYEYIDKMGFYRH